MAHATTTRRSLLRGAGAALTLPMLPGLERRASAAPPKRIVFVYLPQNETEGMLPPTTGGPFSLVGSYLEPLEPFAKKATVFYGLKGAHGHQGGHSECLTGWPSKSFSSWAPTKGPSIDQLIAGRIGRPTPLPSLLLTLQSKQRASGNDGTISWTPDALALPPIHDPYLAFLKVFGGAAPIDDATAARQRALKTSVLDALMADYARVGGRLAAGDRRLLDAHLALLRAQEQNLQSAKPFSCAAGGAAPPKTNPPDYSSGNWPDKAPQQIGVLVSALRCDATRVACLLFGMSQEGNHHAWLGNDEDFHTVAHGSNKSEFQHHFSVRKWDVSQIALLAKSLAAVPEGTGTLLDSTTIVCVPELGLITAADEQHSREGPKGVGGVIIGDCGGYFRTGRAIDFGGRSYHNLLLTLVHAMGYADVTSVGASGTAALDELRA